MSETDISTNGIGHFGDSLTGKKSFNPSTSTEDTYGHSTSQGMPAVSNSSDDDFSAEMVNEINVILDGQRSSKNSIFIVNGVEYRLSSYHLSQDLLRPVILSFTVEKEDLTETCADVVFSNISQIIGKNFEIDVSTSKISQSAESAHPNKAFVFKGVIIDVGASRETASSQSADVTAVSCDALMDGSVNCRSFENMTLSDIVENVLKNYNDIDSQVNPRFKDKIPYIVQYNQSDYSFLRMLAIRFGEWMYSTGEKFVFGDFDDKTYSEVVLGYPGGCLMSYGLQMQMSDFSFGHILTDHYKFGKEGSFVSKNARGIADSQLNEWTDKAYDASLKRYTNVNIESFTSGGFDDGTDEGIKTILDHSLKIEAQGKKTSLMSVSGFSKLASMKIGQSFVIRDNIQNRSGNNLDVQQNALKVITISHSFDYSQEYSNSFVAAPVACKFPSYSDGGVHAEAPSQRAVVVDNADEQKLGRIRVQFPWQKIQSGEMKTPWLRIAVPYAGRQKGSHFIPEIGEEVMIGFEMNNAERPYVIGALYNGGDGIIDEEWASSDSDKGTKNNIKVFRSRNGHTIMFNDHGDAGYLKIYDKKNNTYEITLSSDESKISVRSSGDIEVRAEGNISVSSEKSISLQASDEISIQASRVKVR